MKRQYVGLFLFLLFILFLFPPCVGRGNGYYVGHTFILNVGTFVDVPTVSGATKYLSFVAEIAWQKVALEILAIGTFVGMLKAFCIFEWLGKFSQGKVSLRNIPVSFEKSGHAILMVVIPTVITIVGIYLVGQALTGEIGAWGYLGLLILLTGILSLVSNYKKL